tara:strand:+ start:1335 stop:1541 length:207 start_codon:yes stop_codon:yes gene_type:complete
MEVDYIDIYYDRSVRSWVGIAKTYDHFQVGDAEYVYSKEDVLDWAFMEYPTAQVFIDVVNNGFTKPLN